MKGSRWDASAHCWADNPDHYGAIHFHEDDVVDCGWENDIALTIPADWPSGVYCGCVHLGGRTAYATFHVLPPRGKPGSRLAVLMSTATYVCYGNDGTHVQMRRFLERRRPGLDPGQIVPVGLEQLRARIEAFTLMLVLAIATIVIGTAM